MLWSQNRWIAIVLLVTRTWFCDVLDKITWAAKQSLQQADIHPALDFCVCQTALTMTFAYSVQHSQASEYLVVLFAFCFYDSFTHMHTHAYVITTSSCLSGPQTQMHTLTKLHNRK